MAAIEGFHLSPQQKHVWMLQSHDHCHTYRAWCVAQLQGSIDIARLRMAIESVVRRYEILRTIFQRFADLDIPLQVISEECMYSFSIHDLKGLSQQAQAVQLATLQQEMENIRFDLENGPLLHAVLVEQATRQQLFALSLPTLCTDQISLQYLMQYICSAYTAPAVFEEQQSSVVQYADFSEWQNELLVAEETKTGRNYWTALSPHLRTIVWPFVSQQASKQDYKPTVLHTRLARRSALFQQTEAFATEHDVSLTTLFLACWQVLLYRHSGSSDLVIGVAYDGRKYEELKSAPGLFAQYLPLVSHLETYLSFSDTLRLLDKQTQEIYTWQEFFDWETVQKFGDRREHESLVQICFSWHTVEPIILPDLSCAIQECDASTQRSLLRLACVQYPDGLSLDLHYDNRYITTDDAQRIAEQYSTLLTAALNRSHDDLDTLDMVSQNEYQQVVEKWNARTALQEPVHCIHQWFEEQVRDSPSARALVVEEQQLTYHDLNICANQLAHYLQRIGVGPEKRVGLFMERSCDLIAGLLGILKAGGVYVPLDLAIPSEMLNFILQDVHAPIVLTQTHLQEQLAAYSGRIICVDQIAEELAQEHTYPPTSNVCPENLVYIMFTSGSTGRPKGVAITHANLYAYVRSIIPLLAPPEQASYAVVSTIAADLGHTMLFPALCTGGCLHLLVQERANDPEALMTYMSRFPIDYLKIAPSHLKGLLSAAHSEVLLPHRCLVLGGEAASWDLAKTVHALAPTCRVLNHYGPTETTVGAIVYELDFARPDIDTHQSETLLLGYPLDGVQLYVLDRRMAPVSVWVPGELYIGGTGVARGYAGRPELTAERFVPNPFSLEPGARLYRTGDLMRWQRDGRLAFLGRLDSQVKLRGFRIELGEIEAVLRAHPAIRDAVVQLRERLESTPRLVAYLVPTSEQPSIAQIREFLHERLPEYMLPAVFVLLDRLPVTANGKVDYQALLASLPTRSQVSESYVAPQTPIEQQLAEIWQQVLRLRPEEIGMQDNFFALGGDSILSIQIVTRARQAGLQLTPRQIFQHPTIAQLASLCEQAQPTAEPTAEQGILQGAVPLTPIQRWFLAQEQPHPNHANQALLLRLQQPLHPQALAQALYALLQQHDALRLRFHYTAQGYQQRMVGLAEQSSLLQQVDLRRLPRSLEPGIFTEATRQIQASLNLQEGPLMRAVLFERADTLGQRLLLVIHHLAVDAVSWRILLEDLEQSYQQALLGQPLRLPAKTSSYRHWAERLLDFAQQPGVSQQVAYWSQQEQHSASLLPFDGPAPEAAANIWAEMSSVHTSLTEQQTRALLQQVPQAYQTQIQEALLSALLLTWTQQTRQRSLRLDLEGHGRQEEEAVGVDLSRTVGWFTTLYPVVLTLGASQQPGEVLKQVKEHLRQIPMQGSGYGLLRYLSPDPAVQERLASSYPAQVRFNYLGQFDQMLNTSLLLTLADETSGPSQHRQNHPPYPLEISVLTAREQLQVNWMYNCQLYQTATIEHIAQHYLEQLQVLITHCCSFETGGYTPSDFPGTSISQHDLDDLLAQLGEIPD